VIPYGRQSISEEDIAAVADVLRSDFLTQGPAVPAFEASVASHTGAAYSLAVNSATSALHIACRTIFTYQEGLASSDQVREGQTCASLLRAPTSSPRAMTAPQALRRSLAQSHSLDRPSAPKLYAARRCRIRSTDASADSDHHQGRPAHAASRAEVLPLLRHGRGVVKKTAE
jgi:hypothetical protein